jgi:lipopolysaccharide transport system permease protein
VSTLPLLPLTTTGCLGSRSASEHVLNSESGRLDLSQYSTRPTQHLTAGTGWRAINVRELLQARELLFSLAGRDLRARYKQTLLGVVWIVFQPLLAAGIFTFIFTLIAGLSAPDGLPYFLFTFSGLLAWNAFSGVLSRSSSALVSNAALVSKIYFPRLILPSATVLTVLVDLLVTLCMLAALIAMLWHAPGWTILLMPVCVALLWTLSLGIGLCVSALAVSYRDALHVLPVITQLLMWSSAVFYPTQNVPESFAIAGYIIPVRDIFYLNPLVSLIEAFRWSVLGVGEVRWGYFGYSAVVAMLVPICGALAFRRMERRFADVI